MPDILNKRREIHKSGNMFEGRVISVLSSILFLVLALRNSNVFIEETFIGLTGAFVLLFIANVSINPVVMIPVLGFCLASPSLIGEGSGHASLLILLLTNGCLFLTLLYSASLKGRRDYSGLREPAMVALPFLMAWLLQTSTSHQAVGQFLYTFNDVVFCLLLFSFRHFLMMFLQTVVAAVASLNILYWLYFLFLDPSQNHYVSFSGTLYKRLGFSYVKWGSGIITGGGHTIFHGIPRFVGFTGEPGLWGTLTLLCLGIGVTYFKGKIRVITVVGNLLGLLASQSYSIILIALSSLIVSYLFVHRKNRPLLLASLLVSPLIFLVAVKVLKLVVLVKLQNGESNSLIQRGIAFNQNNFVSNATIYQINYLSLIRSNPVLGFLFISSLLLGIWYAAKSNHIFILGATLSFAGVGILAQPIQFHLGFLILFLALIYPQEKVPDK